MPIRRAAALASALFLTGLAGITAAAAAAPAAAAAAAAADDGFRYASMDSEFVLGRDAEGHSTLEVTESIVALFPADSENRGIRRAIPLGYDGHPTDLRVLGVSDENGAGRSYTTEEDEEGDFLIVTIADEEVVTGRQDYVIRYEQANVTLDPDNGDGQEFYWDVNGTGWDDPFDRVSALVRMEDGLGAHFTGEVACYRGVQGSDQECDALEVRDAGTPVVLAEAHNLAAAENLSVMLGFEDGTFVSRDDSLAASPSGLIGVGAGVLSLGGLAAALIALRVRWRNERGRGTVIAQYEPQAGVDPLLAAELLGKASKAVSATVLDLAVAGALSIVQTAKRKFALELREPARAPRADKPVLRALFGPGAGPGARRKLGEADSELAGELRELTAATKARALAEGYRHKAPTAPRMLLIGATVLTAVVAVLFGVAAADAALGGIWPFLSIVVAVGAAVAVLFLLADVRPLTRQGALAVEHLRGLELYIRLAEADRLRVLQSPSGALRDTAELPVEQVLRLHEKLLPYSVLFGLEKEWAAELASLYERTGEPGWYRGSDGFNAVAFAAGMRGFTSSASTSWSGSSSSSSSSGLGGGGFSGGGGGGGGGGRV